AMLAAGADILDIGGESTRPGAEPVPLAEELRRVLPALEALSGLDVCLSVDTRHARVAAAAAELGAHMLNDVSGFRDPAMVEVLSGTALAGCVMHMQGDPRSMQSNPEYDDVVADVRDFLRGRVEALDRAGVSQDRLVLDPGIGFGKSFAHNMTLLCALERLRVDRLPLLVGVSRKRMIGAITGRPMAERLVGSVVAALAAADRGADILRVHDVAETVDALRVRAAFHDPAHNGIEQQAGSGERTL
ncbi:MAG: dihydropteroate synthase, partial [Gammaproteobacteria bacterium]